MIFIYVDKFIGKADFKGHVLFALQFFLMFPTIGLMMLALYSSERLIVSPNTALEILKGYLAWYTILLWSGVLITAVALIIHISIVIFLKKTGRFAPQHIFMAVLSLVVTSLFSVVMPVEENAHTLMRNAHADIVAIESGELAAITGQLTPERSARRMPGPYRGGESRPFTRAFLTQDRIHHHIYLPNNAMRIANEPSRYFKVTYTPNFRMVVDIMPVDAP